MAAERRLKVDWPACKGHGLCAELVPELVTLDEWGYPILADRPVTRGVQSHAQRAVAACPTLALMLTEAPAVRSDAPRPAAGDPISGAIQAVTGSNPVQRRAPATPPTGPTRVRGRRPAPATPEPLPAVPEPLPHTPEPSRRRGAKPAPPRTREPLPRTPEPMPRQPEPVYREQPSRMPEPVYQEQPSRMPDPMPRQPEPVYREQSPRTPEPMPRQSEPVYREQSPRTPEPLYREPYEPQPVAGRSAEPGPPMPGRRPEPEQPLRTRRSQRDQPMPNRRSQRGRSPQGQRPPEPLVDDPITGAIRAVTGPNAARRTPPTGMARHATPAYGQPALVPEGDPYEPGDSFFDGYQPREAYQPEQPSSRRQAKENQQPRSRREARARRQ